MVEEASLEIRFKKAVETRNYLLDYINYNYLISKKYKYLMKVKNVSV